MDKLARLAEDLTARLNAADQAEIDFELAQLSPAALAVLAAELRHQLDAIACQMCARKCATSSSLPCARLAIRWPHHRN